MTTKTTLMLTAALAASVFALNACERPHPRHRHDDASNAWRSDGPMKVVTALDCPAVQGDLTRRSAAPDGKSCVYDGTLGTEVTLTLNTLAAGKDANTVLDPIAVQLRTELPAQVQNDTGDHDEDKVDIDLPGVSIHAGGDGRATIRAGHGDDGVTVNANQQGAEVHIQDGHGPGVRKILILASENPGPHGYRVAGYDARGPAGGPLVVAVVKSKNDDHDEVFSDVRSLVRHNVGG